MEKYASLASVWKAQGKDYGKALSGLWKTCLLRLKSSCKSYRKALVVLMRFFTSLRKFTTAHPFTLPQPLPPTLPHARPSAHFTTTFTTGEGEPSALTLWRLCLSRLFTRKRERKILFEEEMTGMRIEIAPGCGDTTLRKHPLLRRADSR